MDDLRKADVVFFGDSITNNWNVAERFSYLGTVSNKGISGNKIEQMAARFDDDVLALKPKMCVFMGGINNLWTLDAFMKEKDFEGFGDESFRIVEHVKKTWAEIFLRAQAAGIKLVVCSITPLKGSYRKNIIRELNCNLRLLAIKFGLDYVDYYSVMSDENGILLDGITLDELHPNENGYEIMERVLKEALVTAS